MCRICHLQSVAAGFEAQQTARQLVDRLGEPFAAEVRTVGRGGDYAGVIRSRGALRAGRWRIVHAWDRISLMAGVVSGAPRIVVTPPADDAHRVIRLARVAAMYRSVQIVCPTQALHRLAIELGTPAEHCHLIRPGIDPVRIPPQPNRDLRRELGFGDQEIVLLAAGESTPAAAHEVAVWAMSILRVVQPAYRLLLWGRGSAVDKVARFATGIGDRASTHFAQQRLRRPVAFEQLLGVADVVLVTARDVVDTLPIAKSMAAGLPIISTTTPTTSELLKDGYTALMVDQPQARLIAQRIIDLRSDPSLQRAISDAAGQEARARFTQSHLIDQYRDFYHQVAVAETTAIPQPPSLAGA